MYQQSFLLALLVSAYTLAMAAGVALGTVIHPLFGLCLSALLVAATHKGMAAVLRHRRRVRRRPVIVSPSVTARLR